MSDIRNSVAVKFGNDAKAERVSKEHGDKEHGDIALELNIPDITTEIANKERTTHSYFYSWQRNERLLQEFAEFLKTRSIPSNNKVKSFVVETSNTFTTQAITNADIPVANDMIDYSYSTDPNRTPPAGWVNVKTIEDAGTGVRIDFLKNSTTNQLTVVTRGTQNLPNLYADITLKENPPLAPIISSVTGFIKGLDEVKNHSMTVDFIGHSYGGNGALMLADDFIEHGGIADAQARSRVLTFNSAGLPGYDARKAANLDPITTNLRAVEAWSAGANGTGQPSAGDLVSLIFWQPGTTYEVPISGTNLGWNDMHSMVGMPREIDLSGLRTLNGSQMPGGMSDRMSLQLTENGGWIGNDSQLTDGEALGRIAA